MVAVGAVGVSLDVGRVGSWWGGGGLSLDLSAVIVCCLTDVVVEEGYSLLFEDEAQSCKHEVEVQRVCWALWRGLWVVFYVDACCVTGC